MWFMYDGMKWLCNARCKYNNLNKYKMMKMIEQNNLNAYILYKI